MEKQKAARNDRFNEIQDSAKLTQEMKVWPVDCPQIDHLDSGISIVFLLAGVLERRDRFTSQFRGSSSAN